MMPAGRHPEAARERDVSSRPREPHSPHRRRHPRGDVLRERDDSETNVSDTETICKENNPGSGRYFRPAIMPYLTTFGRRFWRQSFPQ